MPVLTMVGVATVTLDVVVKASLGYAITIWTSTLMRVAAAAEPPLLSHPTMDQLRRAYFSRLLHHTGRIQADLLLLK